MFIVLSAARFIILCRAPALRIDMLDAIIPIAKVAVERLCKQLESYRGTNQPGALRLLFAASRLCLPAVANRCWPPVHGMLHVCLADAFRHDIPSSIHLTSCALAWGWYPAAVDLEEEFRLLTLQIIGEAILSLPPDECDRVFPHLYLPVRTGGSWVAAHCIVAAGC